MKNEKLYFARMKKYDEFYTRYEDIQNVRNLFNICIFSKKNYLEKIV